MLAPLLVAFYETVRQGSVTAAAKRLEVSQPTITARIQQLEKQYGVELFHRRGSRFDLTDAGAALMPLIDRMQQIESDIDFTLQFDFRKHRVALTPTCPTQVQKSIRRRRNNCY